MSYDASGPEVRIRCLLSKSGILDAVRHGIAVESTNVALFWAYYDQPSWSRVFDLDPEPVFGEGGLTTAVHLDVARTRRAEVVPTKPEVVRYFFSPEILAWNQPAVVTVYGDQEPLDYCEGLEQVLDYESRLVDEFHPVTAASAENDLPPVLEAWRAWSATDGLSNGRVLLEIATSCAEEAKQISLPRFWEVRRLGQDLRAAIEEAETTGTDQAFAGLAAEVWATGTALDELEDRVTKEKSRQFDQQVADEWVRDHGSSRLQKALEAGLLDKSLGAYRDERLALERPGWQWSGEPKTYKDIVNPDEAVLDALLEARQVDPDVRLVFSPEHGPMLVAMFLGRYIATTAVVDPHVVDPHVVDPHMVDNADEPF